MPSAALIVLIEDDSEFVAYTTYLLNYLFKKFKDLEIRLGNVLLINKTNKQDIIDQLVYFEANKHNDWILVTGCRPSDDNLIDELVEKALLNKKQQEISPFPNQVDLNQNSLSLTLLNNRVFILNNQFFYFNLAACLSYLNKETKKNLFRFSFDSVEKIRLFLNKIEDYFCLGEIFKSESNLSSISYSNKSIELNSLQTNYFESLIEIKIKNVDLAQNFANNFVSFINETLLLDNYLNADFYLYNFENTTKYLNNYYLNMNSSRMDIEFLLSNIDYNLFLSKLNASLKVIEDSFDQNKNEQMCISFNGGKDCCVVLYLFYAVASRLGIKFPIYLLLIKIKNEFDEMNFFIQNTLKQFYKSSIEFIVFEDEKKSMKECLSELKQIRPKIDKIFIGTRRSDGDYFKNMSSFAPTDSDWPSYMRVNPILDWTFSEVWYFIRVLQLPYCSLYDQGYTSIDNTENTVKNRNLLRHDGASYMPAYMLKNQESERDSRRKKIKT